jgi:endonuclease-3 related protein
MRSLKKLFRQLSALHGAQGWWPVRSEWPGRGYHPGKTGIPATRKGAFEVCMGAVLTQNTAWTQVEKALENLYNVQWTSPEKILKVSPEELAEQIRPAGYRNQKAAYLQAVAAWFLSKKGKPAVKDASELEEERCGLLKIRGVGQETADSILLYAFHLPTFVIDAYTRRICATLQIADFRAPYETLRALFMKALPPDTVLYQEYHALLVQHAKLYYSGKDKEGSRCPIATLSS